MGELLADALVHRLLSSGKQQGLSFGQRLDDTAHDRGGLHARKGVGARGDFAQEDHRTQFTLSQNC